MPNIRSSWRGDRGKKRKSYCQRPRQPIPRDPLCSDHAPLRHLYGTFGWDDTQWTASGWLASSQQEGPALAAVRRSSGERADAGSAAKQPCIHRMTLKSTKAKGFPSSWDCVVPPYVVPPDRFTRTARAAPIRSLTSRPAPPATAPCVHVKITHTPVSMT